MEFTKLTDYAAFINMNDEIKVGDVVITGKLRSVINEKSFTEQYMKLINLHKEKEDLIIIRPNVNKITGSIILDCIQRFKKLEKMKNIYCAYESLIIYENKKNEILESFRQTHDLTKVKELRKVEKEIQSCIKIKI